MSQLSFLIRKARSISGLVVVLLIFLISVNIWLYKNQPDADANKLKNGFSKDILAHVDSVDNADFVNSMVNEMKDSKKEELLDQIYRELKSSKEQELTDKLYKDLKAMNEAKIVNDLKENIIKTKTEELKKEAKEEMKKNMDEEFTKEIFEGRKISTSLLSQLSREFLINNQDDVKKYATSVVLENLADKFPDIPKYKIAHAIEEQLKTKLNKKDYYRYIMNDVLIANAPSTTLTDENIGRKVQPGFYRDQRTLSRNSLMHDHYHLSDEQFKDMKSKHDKLVKVLKLIEDPPVEFVSGKGIVISGGGAYFGVALVAIAQIREMGSELPIELIMNNRKEYDEQICEDLLPRKFNAKCLIIEDELGSDVLESLEFSDGSQNFLLKVLGFLVTSFDQIIAIDADNMPLKNVDHLLTSEPYLSTKWVMWPDLWIKAPSPLFYDIIGLELGEAVGRRGLANDGSYSDYVKKDKDDIAIHDREGAPTSRTVESGQMVFSKRAHFRAYLLSLYYNIYGKSHYYDMIYQGIPGLGDKDTFVPALQALNEPYSIVDHDVWLAGYDAVDNEGNTFFQETTIVQYDPVQHLAFTADWKKFLQLKGLDTRLWAFQSNGFTNNLKEEFLNSHKKQVQEEELKEDGTKETITKEVPYKLPDVFFMHIHKPKINPIKGDNNFGIHTRRNLGLPGKYSDFGTTDWELKFHSIAKWVVCKGITSESFWKTAPITQLEACKKETEYVEFLKKDSRDLSAEKLKFDQQNS